MTTPTAAEVGQKASRLMVIAQELDELASGMEILSPGFQERLQDMVDTLVEEARHLAELHQWMSGPPPDALGALSAWLRESRRAEVRTDSRSCSPVRGTGKRTRPS